ncbi:MAG: FecR family protein [Planctomycetota bacterium]|jgi:hypothetical protein
MKPDHERLIDLLLHELEAEEAHDLEARLGADPALAARRDEYAQAIALVRDAADEGWQEQRRGRMVWLRPAAAAAAVVLVVVGLFFMNGHPAPDETRFEPNTTFGYLRAEETDAAGRVPTPSTAAQITLRKGSLEVAAIGSDRAYRLAEGDAIQPGTELRSQADSRVRIDLPHGGILFLGPVSTVQVRARPDGATALRLKGGVACTVAGDRPVHLAVDGTDLLLRQNAGAAFLRFSPPEAVNLRGALVLRHDRGLFDVPEGERLPAACANDPRTVPVTDEELALDWYRDLVYRTWRVERVEWDRPGVSLALRIEAETLLYLRLVPLQDGELEVGRGDVTKRFELHRGATLELRLRLADLGTGERLIVTPPTAIREARLFEAVPR